MTDRSPTPQTCRREARTALFSASNWISSMLCCFAVMLMVFTAVFLTDAALAAVSLFFPVPYLADVILYLAWYLLLSPLCIGVFCYHIDLHRASLGDGPAHVPPSVIFAPYAHLSAIVSAWIQMLSVILTCEGIVLSAYLLLRTAAMFSLTLSPVGALLLTASLLFFLAILFFAVRCSPALFFSLTRPREPFYRSVIRAWRATRTTAPCAVVLGLGFLAAALLSVLFTAAVAFFLYVLPTGLFTYITYCHAVSRREMIV